MPDGVKIFHLPTYRALCLGEPHKFIKFQSVETSAHPCAGMTEYGAHSGIKRGRRDGLSICSVKNWSPPV